MNKEMQLNDFIKASEIVKNVTRDTALIPSDFFSFQSGNRIYFKPENMQKTGSYKVRGAYYKISTLSEEERNRGLIAASAGNHAQGVAHGASSFGAKCVIVMPQTTPLIKVNRTKSYGAEVILFGDVYDEAEAYARELADKEGYTFIHPFDDLDVALGQGTIAKEILDELPDAEYILVPIGGGGLACGVSTYAKLINPDIKIIGVEPSGAASLKEALKMDKPATLDEVNTIADGTAVKKIGDKVFPYLKKNLDRVLTVQDQDLVAAFLDMVENHKTIVENSGLLSAAALKQLKGLGIENKKVVAILSGGNMDVITMSSVVQNGLIKRDRIFTFSILLPDKPGELLNVAKVIASQEGNVVRLDHNQFVNVDRKAGVELKVTLEAFGTDHKERILNALKENGYEPKLEPVQL